MVLRLSIICLIFTGGCFLYADNPYYCPGRNPNNNCTEDPAPDAPKACTSSSDCATPTSVCDLGGTLTCVQCTQAEDDACIGTTPVCGPQNTCTACSSHSQCTDSNVCLPDGSCGDESQVAYVDPSSSDNNECSKAMPCTRIAKALATGRPYVKLKGTTDVGGTATIDGQAVTLLAEPGAKLTRTNNGLLLEVKGTSRVEIYDLEIGGASGAQGIGISIPPGGTPSISLVRTKVVGNQSMGISASGGTLTVSQSTISGNTGGGISSSGGTLTVSQSTISGNGGGGISASAAQFDLTNNFIVKNGGPTSSFGGVLLTQITAAGSHRFDFNTVAQNQATSGITAGVVCSLIATPLAFSSDIVYGNGPSTQVDGANCSWSFSDIGPTAATGTGNINMDPLFANAAQNNFHLMPNSPAKDAADPAATLTDDFDGDFRPQGDRRDIGADEILP